MVKKDRFYWKRKIAYDEFLDLFTQRTDTLYFIWNENGRPGKIINYICDIIDQIFNSNNS